MPGSVCQRLLKVKGVVQGVGFRPFVFRLATAMGLCGYVCNKGSSVEILVQGEEPRLKAFLAELKAKPPSQARIEELEEIKLSLEKHYDDFTIKPSVEETEEQHRLPADLATCSDCLRELFDPKDRRYFYPYINCTNCGPRYSIIKALPYDRSQTVMANFKMCRECAAEYTDPYNRRFHAQPNACHRCGPRISLVDGKGNPIATGGDPHSMQRLLAEAARMLKEGAILALKGIGGFHLACDALNEKAVQRLRLCKGREAKPFAVMVRDLVQACQYAELSEAEKKRLERPDRPILLVPKKNSQALADSVAPKNNELGLLLPYTPLQHLLFSLLDVPLVMTSANNTGEPIIYENAYAIQRLGHTIADYLIIGERDILIPLDDSVLRIFNKADYPIRRARGLCPEPVIIEERFSVPVLAVGAELKNSICLAKGESAYLSQYLGDLKSREVYEVFLKAIGHLTDLCQVKPKIIAHDLHPLYLSSQFAQDPPLGWEWVLEALKFPVQHHHAHLVSCLVENGLRGPALGLALDGTGLGSDETIWGGEILQFDTADFSRLAYIKPVPMPGGELAIREPWRMALAWLKEAFGDQFIEHLPPAFKVIPEAKLLVTKVQLLKASNLPTTSSCGRLFAAFSALCGICLKASYEAQPEIELEHSQTQTDQRPLSFEIETTLQGFIIHPEEAIRQAVQELLEGGSANELATRFHYGLAEALVSAAARLAHALGLKNVALSGGCFLNETLLGLIVNKLERLGLKPIYHHRLPCNDGSVALGQACVARARLKV